MERNLETYSAERRSPEGKSCTEPRNDEVKRDLCNLDASKPRCIDGYCLFVDLRGQRKSSCIVRSPVARPKVAAKARNRDAITVR